MKRVKLQIKLAFVFSLISIITVIILIIVANISSKYIFERYLTTKHAERDSFFVKLLENSYSKKNGFEKGEFDKITMYAMMDSLKIWITDDKGEIIFMVNYLGHFKEMDKMVAFEEYENKNLDKSISKLPIKFEKVIVGWINVENDKEMPLPSSDVNFLKNFNQWIFIAGFISLIISLFISFIISKSIAKPIKEATRIAKEIKNGKLDVRITKTGDTDEIEELAKTINHLAESLDMQEKIKRQLALDLAHEIRTPMTTILSHLDAIIDGIWKPSRDRFESIRDEMLRLIKLVKDIEKLDELEEIMTLSLTEFNLSELVERICSNFGGEIEANELILEKKIDKGILVNGDKDRISQVMVNVLSNSVKYNRENGKIVVSLSKAADGILLMVEDNGIGIKQEHIPFIFERLYRVESSRARSTGGNGIGLSVVKAIVKLHNWKIDVESEEGKGTRVKILI